MISDFKAQMRYYIDLIPAAYRVWPELPATKFTCAINGPTNGHFDYGNGGPTVVFPIIFKKHFTSGGNHIAA